MHKKLEIVDLDIPKDDVECWERYPKYRWVYDKSRLFDSQGIKWSPFKTNDLTDVLPVLSLVSSADIDVGMGTIYYKSPVGVEIISEIYLTKGEIKVMQHYDKTLGTNISSVPGDIEIRIIAFISMHFQKFTGIVSIETIGTDIYSIKLRPSYPELALKANNDIVKIVKRIYKRSGLHVNGPADQDFHETLTS